MKSLHIAGFFYIFVLPKQKIAKSALFLQAKQKYNVLVNSLLLQIQNNILLKNQIKR
jgi:hypothetical protein